MQSYKGGRWEIVGFPQVLALPEIGNDPPNQSGSQFLPRLSLFINVAHSLLTR